MKVYVATSGEYSDYRIAHVFARREDADAYQGADRTEEYEVREGPVEMRPWHTLTWATEIPDREATSMALANPFEQSWPKDFDGDERNVSHAWFGPPHRTGPVLQVEGWDLARVRKVYSEQRAQHLAGQPHGAE
ncbi:MAG TPA: hypothetical protein VFQ68_09760 [Streptosporangiaceae bacterium]|nr:hypothetical protein [Streptosporangiaceae bacterium]